MPLTNDPISDLTALAERPADTDLLVVVDESDTTDAPTGTTKGIEYANLTKLNVVTITDANHTATSEEDVIFYDLSAGNAKTLTFELAADRTRPRCVKNLAASTAVLTIEGDGSETIDGAANIELAPGDVYWFIPRSSSAWESI